MSTAAEGTEVLRGMHVESAPMRLARVRPAAAAASAQGGPEPQAAARAEEEALRQCFEQAERAGHEKGERAGYEAGLRKGLAAAATQSQAAVEEAVARATAALQAQRAQLSGLSQSLERAAEEALALAEDEMVALCFDAICRMVGSAAVQPDVVREQVRALAAAAAFRDRAAVHVHPDDAALLAAGEDAGQGASRLDWVADADVQLGGCVLRAKAGGLDARLETMLAACRQALLAARRERAARTAPAQGSLA